MWTTISRMLDKPIILCIKILIKVMKSVLKRHYSNKAVQFRSALPCISWQSCECFSFTMTLSTIALIKVTINTVSWTLIVRILVYPAASWNMSLNHI
ncbi:hypothetical protein MT418_8584 [Batrachochytrium dendrobatidis]